MKTPRAFFGLMRVQALCVLLSALALCACEGIGRELIYGPKQGRAKEIKCDADLPECELPRPVATFTQFVPKDQSLPPCKLSGEGLARSRVGLSDCALRIEAAEPVVRELTEATLFRVRIELVGAASLRLHDSFLSGCAVVAEEGESGRMGSLEVSHSRLTSVDAHVGQLDLLSSVVQGSTLAADWLVATDLEMTSSELSVGDGLISASLLLFSAIPQCDALLLAGSIARNVRIAACTGVTRIYEGAFTRVQLDGTIEADRAAIAEATFGLEAETSLLSYRTSVNVVMFCDQFQTLRTSTGTLSCAGCEGPLAEGEPDACMEQFHDTSVDEGNLCEALVVLPACDSFPRRTRPLNET